MEDQPGIIGQIATLLGQHDVNIKNIGIMHSREEEPGVLKIAFDSRDAQYKAAEILQRHSFVAFIDS